MSNYANAISKVIAIDNNIRHHHRKNLINLVNITDVCILEQIAERLELQEQRH
jgi:hypothetical protein